MRGQALRPRGMGKEDRRGASISPAQAPGMGVDGSAEPQGGARPAPREADREQQGVISKATSHLFSLHVLGLKHLGQLCTPRLHLTCKPDRRQAAWSLPSLCSHLP